MFKKFFFITALALFLGAKSVLATSNLSVRIAQPKSPTNQNSFDINFVALDISGQAVTVKCYKKGPSDGGFSQFGSAISLAAGGGSGNCSADSTVISQGDGTYQFYVTATTASETANSSTDSVDYKTSGPGTPSNYSKDKTGACTYRINFKTSDDGGKTVKVEIYRSTSTTFTLDGGTRVGTVAIGSNTDGHFDNTVPDCNATYYYAIRAFDAAGNGSGWVGDNVNVTAPTTTTPGGRTAGGGAIPVSGGTANILGAGKEATPGGEELGTATPSPAPETVELPGKAQPGLGWFWIVLGLIVLGVIAYVLSRRQNQNQV